MHSIGIGLPIPTLRTSIAFVNDGFVRPLISEVMHMMSSTKQVWLSEFGGEEKQREIDRLFEGDTKFLFLSFDRNTGALSKVVTLKKRAFQLASAKSVPCGVYVDVLRTLTRPPFDNEQLRQSVMLIVFEEVETEHNSLDTLKRVAFPNLVDVVHAPGTTQARMNAIAASIKKIAG